MVDLVKQLREPVSGESAQVMVRWAADEIERLRSELETLKSVARGAVQAARREYHANGTYWSGVPTVDIPCDGCRRPIMDHDPRTHACPTVKATESLK